MASPTTVMLSVVATANLVKAGLKNPNLGYYWTAAHQLPPSSSPKSTTLLHPSIVGSHFPLLRPSADTNLPAHQVDKVGVLLPYGYATLATYMYMYTLCFHKVDSIEQASSTAHALMTHRVTHIESSSNH